MSKQITVGKYNIEIKEDLSWYDSKELEAVMIGGAKMSMNGNVPQLSGIEGDILFKAKIKLFEIAIISIKEEDGKEYPFSINWLKTLSKKDGEVLDFLIDEAYKTEKKN